MVILFNNKMLVSHQVSKNEMAWRLCDALDVIDYLHSQNRIILGGDILTADLKPNYDSWFFNVNRTKDFTSNSNESCCAANEYLRKYIESNGYSYYVVIVTE